MAKETKTNSMPLFPGKGKGKIDIPTSLDLQDNLLTSSLVSEEEDEMMSLINRVKQKTFYEFLVEDWAYGYDNPDDFKAWYIKDIAEKIQKALVEHTNVSLIMPRGHRKSTIMHGLSIYLLLWCDYRDTKVIYLSASEDAAKLTR